MTARTLLISFIGEDGPRLMAGVGEFLPAKVSIPLPDADKVELVDIIAMDKRRTSRKWLSTRKFILHR